MSFQTTHAIAVTRSLQRLATYLVLIFLGIAQAYAGQVTLAWDASPSSNVGGYKIYYGQTSGSYSANVDAGKQTSYTVSNLTAGSTYYFVATAYDTTGATESGYSNQVNVVVPSPPVASFSASATSGVAPLTVTFACTSTGDITSRSWDLGDGTTATGAVVSKYYANPGTYLVSLTAAGVGGSSTATQTVTLSAPATPPLAAFSANATSGTAPFTVSFADASTGSVTAWSWQFGDGGSSNQQNPSYTYATAGTYTVSLTATGPGGSNTSTKADYIMVAVSGSGGGGGGSGDSSGLVAAYGFDEISGSQVLDASGNANHGTIYQATRITSGRFGKALKFDGVNDWVTVNDSASLDLTSKMTLEAWVYPTTYLTGWRTILMKEQNGGAAYYLEANSDSNQPVAGITVGSEEIVRGGTRLAKNTWAHVTGTYDGQYFRLYVNGVQVANQAQSGNIVVSNGQLRIGGNAVWGEYFTGYIDEIRIYNRALSPTEIVADRDQAVASASPAQFKIGDKNVEITTDYNPQGMAEAFQTTAQASAALAEIQVYLDAKSTATKLVAGIYTDGSGHPKTRLGQGSLTSLKAGAWNSVPIPPANIVSGQRYWLAILAPKGQIRFRIQGGNGGAMETSKSSSLTSLPSTWATGNVYGGAPMSVFGGGY